jgi:hypothetical protein
MTKLVTPTGEAKNTLSFYLTLSTFSSPIMETTLRTIKGRVIRLGKTFLTDLDHTTSSTRKLVTPETLTSTWAQAIQPTDPQLDVGHDCLNQYKS